MAENSTGGKTLRQRVRALEIAYTQMEARFNRIHGSEPSDEDVPEFKLVLPIPRRRGPKRKIEVDDRLHLREMLITFLEINWHNLEPILRHVARMKVADRQAWFERAIASLGPQQSSYAYAGEYLVRPKIVQALCDFVRDRVRYHGNPRSIANALAGAEKVSWRRSLDVFEKVPHPVTILGASAHLAYVRRTYKTLYPRLLERPLSKKTLRILDKYEDDYLWVFKQGEAKIDEFLALAKPSEALLRNLGIRTDKSRAKARPAL